MSLRIASFKLRFFDDHVRIVPATDARGCPFRGPGVDLRGDVAREAFALARPVVAWFEARGPLLLRSLAIDLAKLRVVATAEDTDRPRVIRVDASSVTELVSRAAPLVERLGVLAEAQLARRAAT